MEISDALVSIGVMQNRLGERLLARIANLKISQAEAARRCGLSAPRLNNYIVGPPKGRTPDLDTLMRIAKALNTTTDYLLGFSAVQPPDVASVVKRLLELEGLDPARAEALAATAEEALTVLSALQDEGDAETRSRIAAQAAWQLRDAAKPLQ